MVYTVGCIEDEVEVGNEIDKRNEASFPFVALRRIWTRSCGVCLCLKT